MADKEMSFWEHLDDLRGVLLRMGATVAIAAVALFCVMPRIFDRIILAPCHDSFPLYRLFDIITAAWTGSEQAKPWSMELINTQLASQFFIHISASCQLAVALTFPLLLYQLWTFISPALYPDERRHSARAFVAGNALFYTGVATGYFLVFPLTLRFLAGYQLSGLITNTITIDSYMDNLTSILLVMGIVFEIPVMAWFLGRAGLMDRSFFNRFRRHAVVALTVAAAVITPTSDPFTLAVVFVPLYMLWEASALVVPAAAKRNAKSVADAML
ncbi:MAG: twin-arginine translocase subunit TatC [Muribaculaceae bacterium]|nr:twin-arginine translocase subunit TatC [Muribaculaceae bacterium]